MEPEIKKQNFKVFFIMLVLWLLTIISIIVGIKLYEKHEGAAYADIALPYIEQVIVKISEWDPEITRALMAPEVLETIPEESFVQAMTLFSKLGKLQSMEEPEFVKLFAEEKIDIGTHTILEYNIDAKYENGDAMISVKLLDRGGSFVLYRFNFRSAVLVE